MMSSSNLILEEQLKLPVWKHYFCNLSQEEIKKILLIAVKITMFGDLPETKLKLQILENYINSLNREQAQNIILQAIYSLDLFG
jgi:hypothetical protein